MLGFSRSMQPEIGMRRFHLVRHKDISGISGTGVVAEGGEFADGTVAMKWLTNLSILEVSPNIHTIEAVHGHGGSTTIEWVDKEVA